MKRPIRTTINGKPITLDTEDDRTLLWVLRTDLGLTGTKYGCGEGICGACTVVVGGTARRACKLPLDQVEGKDVTTIEGLAPAGGLHPLQQAFIDHGAFQCGFCTPGMLLNAHAFLRGNAAPSHEAIAARMEHNLCRCGAHRRIVDAIAAAAEAMKVRL